ncbi:MAG: hypothetical protein AAF331_11690 [Pseudomonadota bacterium]
MSRSVALGALALSLSLPAAADPVLEMMRSLSTDGPIYSYEMTYSDTDVTANGLIDPSKPEGERIEIYAPDESEWTKDFRDGIADMEAETDGDIWCAEFAEMVPNSATATTEDDTTVTYAFTPEPEADADKNEKKMMKQLNGTVILDKSDGAVLAFSMILPKPYKPAMVAKINRFEMAASCDRAPDGRTYVEQFSFDIKGSAMMQTFEESVSRKITKLLDPVG